MTEEVLLTQEGFNKLEAEMEHLITVKRKEVAERIKEAISYGDISENSEYDSAKNEQAELEERINNLENKLSKAKIIKDEDITGDRVNIGLTIKLKNLKTKETEIYTIVGSTEADPLEGKISNESLVGSALIGKKINQKVDIHALAGLIKYQIEDIYRGR